MDVLYIKKIFITAICETFALCCSLSYAFMITNIETDDIARRTYLSK